MDLSSSVLAWQAKLRKQSKVLNEDDSLNIAHSSAILECVYLHRFLEHSWLKEGCSCSLHSSYFTTQIWKTPMRQKQVCEVNRFLHGSIALAQLWVVPLTDNEQLLQNCRAQLLLVRYFQIWPFIGWFSHCKVIAIAVRNWWKLQQKRFLYSHYI